MSPNPRFVVLFAGWFAALYALTEWGREIGVTPLAVQWLVLEPAAAVLNGFPALAGVVVDGQRLVSPGLRLNVLPGCEGTEAWALLLAAILAAPLTWRRKVLGAAMGTGLVLTLNLARMVVLFWAARDDRVLFNALHGYVAPTLIVVAASMFYLTLCATAQRQQP